MKSTQWAALLQALAKEKVVTSKGICPVTLHVSTFPTLLSLLGAPEAVGTVLLLCVHLARNVKQGRNSAPPHHSLFTNSKPSSP